MSGEGHTAGVSAGPSSSSGRGLVLEPRGRPRPRFLGCPSASSAEASARFSASAYITRARV